MQKHEVASRQLQDANTIAENLLHLPNGTIDETPLLVKVPGETKINTLHQAYARLGDTRIAPQGSTSQEDGRMASTMNFRHTTPQKDNPTTRQINIHGMT